jgi:hypothetical protein
MSLKLVPLVTLLTLAASVGTSVAQPEMEVTPFFGFRSQGAFRTGEATDNIILEVDNSTALGVFFDLGLTDHVKLDALWTHQGTKVLTGETPTVNGGGTTTSSSEIAPGQPLFDLGIDYIHGGILYGGGSDIFSAYATANAGVTLLNPDLEGASRLTKFSFSLGAGFRTEFNDRLGFRFDGRVFGTRAGSKRDQVACSVFGCATFEAAATFWQVHFIGGVIIKL